MPWSVEPVPSLAAAEARWVALVGAAQAVDPFARVNVLVGSNAQRLYYRRRLAVERAAAANVRFFTPVDLAMALRQHARPPQAPPPRQPVPDGAEALLAEDALRRLHAAHALRQLDPQVQGVAAAVAASLTDLREGSVSADAFRRALRRDDDPKLHDLAAIFGDYAQRAETRLDRTASYEDAVDALLVPDAAVREALGGSPLLVLGIYDATPIQQALLQRCGEVAGAHVLLVAPETPDFRFARRFAEDCARRGATVRAGPVIAPQAAPDDSPDFSAFSAPTRQAEVEEIARRILALARDHAVPFQEIAVLHRLDEGYDDLIAAALERAEVPVFRAGGVPLRHLASGRALLVLLDLLSAKPARHRLLEFLASPGLRERIPPGIQPRPVTWERLSKQAGMVSGWPRFLAQLDALADRQATADTDPAFPQQATRELRAVVAGLADAALERAAIASWEAMSRWFAHVAEAFLRPDGGDGDRPAGLEIALGRVRALAALDNLGIACTAEAFQAAATRAIRRAAVTGRPGLGSGVFVGNVNTARGLRFDAVFLAECAERLFPALVRQDALMLDSERESLNQRLGRYALPLKRAREDEERLLAALVPHAARRFFTASWARRTGATGAPRLGSDFIRHWHPAVEDELITVEEMERRGLIQRLSPRLGGAAPPLAAQQASDWSIATRALDASDLRIAVLESAPDAAAGLLQRLWPGYERYRLARDARNDRTFTAYDGVLPPEATAADLLPQALSPTALETYAVCPYRYFLRSVLRVGAVPDPGDTLEMTPLDRGVLVHRILEHWVRAWLGSGLPWPDYLRDDTRLQAIAAEEFGRSQQSGVAGLPAAWRIIQADVLDDLRRVVREERARAAAGSAPDAVEQEFRDVPLTLPDGTVLRFNGRIDRVDMGPDGPIAIDYKTGRARKRAGDYRNGSALQLPVYLHAVAAARGLDPAAVRAEYWYATRAGNFERSVLRGAEALADPAFWEALAVITGGIRAGRFFPYPGPSRGDRDRRPNCTYCDYRTVCTTDVDRRFEAKARNDPEPVRLFQVLQARGGEA